MGEEQAGTRAMRNKRARNKLTAKLCMLVSERSFLNLERNERNGGREERKKMGVGFRLISEKGLRIKLHNTLVSVCSAAETVEGSSLSLESVDDVESGDGLSLGVFGVDNGVTDNVLEEGAEDSAGLLVDVRGDSLDTTSAGKSADSRLGDSEDGLTEGLATAHVDSLGAGLAAAHAAFTFATAAADLSSWCHL